MSAEAPRIEVRGVRHALPGREGPVPVLAGVDLTVAPGELVALVGPSGCGKSTLLGVVAGLTAPDEGEVRLVPGDGGARLGRLTLMPQHDALLPWRTVRDNVALGPALAGAGRAEARRAAATTLRRFGLAGFEDHYPHALSGGMRQRAALARTLLGGRAAWLLDEPFGALDALTRADLHGVLAALHEEHRPTVILVTHDLDEALTLADRVLVLTPRPAAVAAEIVVDLPRPRGPRTAADPAAAALRGRLLDALEETGALA